MEHINPLTQDVICEQSTTSGSVVTIRCLSAVPQEIEDLLAKIAEEEAAKEEQGN